VNLPEIFGFYGILTNPIKGFDYLTEMFVANEIPLIQLRIKNAEKDEVLKVAWRLRKITEGTKSRLIINDFPDICKKVQAEGVHLGQGDATPESAREMLGKGFIVGLSTHSVSEMNAACEKRGKKKKRFIVT